MHGPLVPFDTPGLKVVRPLKLFGFDDAPSGHCELLFDNVNVPVENVILGEGKGFQIAQERLGPGRIHHMMRLIGLAERALEMTVKRATSRKTFGKPLVGHGVIRNYIAQSRIDIEMSRLLVMKTAFLIDRHGNQKARGEIAMIKAQIPRMIENVLDRAIQIHGAGGFSDADFGLAKAWAGARSLRMADGPDEVHMETVAKIELSKQQVKQISDGVPKEANSLDTQFQQAMQSISRIPNINEQDVLLLYGIFKQATAGDAGDKEPPAEDIRGRAKYQSWKSNKGLSSNEAKEKYIRTIKQLAQRAKM
jgi:acyl-CoA-binding protein